MGENQAHTTNQRTPTIIDSHLDFYTFPSMHPSNHPSKQTTNHPLIHLAALTLHALTWVQPVFPAFVWVPWYEKQPHAPQQ